jgi:hypothetical protein
MYARICSSTRTAARRNASSRNALVALAKLDGLRRHLRDVHFAVLQALD